MKKIILYIFIILIGFAMILLIKYSIRPSYQNSHNKIITFILGVAPNFLIGITFPLLLKLIYPRLKAVSIFLLSFSAIVLMEYELHLNNRNFDMFDIIFSIVGIFIWYISFNHSIE